MTSGELLSRRSFLIGVSAVGGGLALSLAVPFAPVRTAEEAPEVTAWLLIGSDNSVVIRVARAEMGQGAHTGLAMLVAEELECDWTKVSTEFVSPEENTRRERIWGDMSTGASRSIAASQLYLRQAGATAREMLIAAAAARWRVPASECVAAASVITHRPSGRKITFGAIAEAASQVPPPVDVKLKDPSEWTLAGKPRRRLDVPAKVTAQPIYAIDVRLPGMLYAAIMHCPVFGGAPKTIDDSAVATMKGVRRVVRLPNAVAVIADSWWRAKRAVEALPIEWDPRGNGRVSSASIAASVRAGLSETKSQVGRSDGDVAAAMPTAIKHVAADYEVPFLAHATMEPQTCTAHVVNGGVEVWVPTQEPMTALATAASAAGVPNEKVVVHGTFLGGGFGRRAAIQEFVRQAVLIAKEVDVPVKLLWSREQDIQHDYYRPFGMGRLVAGLGADGMPVAWKIRLAGPSFVHGLVPGFGMTFVDRTFISGLAEACAAWGVARDQLHAKYLLQGIVRRRDGACGRRGSVSVSPPPAAQQREKPGGARCRGETRRLVWSSAGGRASRHCGDRSLRQHLRAGGRGFRRARRSPRPPRHLGARLRPRGQSAVDFDADRRRRHFRADRGFDRRDHHQGRRRRAVQFRFL
jgi:isoquinoline 1-oxidoreductase beta subunit